MCEFAVSVPAKLVLMGEHSVVYGHPAIVASFGLRLSVRLETAGVTPGIVELILPQVGVDETASWHDLEVYASGARERWEGYANDPALMPFGRVRGSDPAHVVKIAAAEAVRGRGSTELPGLRLRVDSPIPVGSGFGSSAAVAAGVLAAVHDWLGCPVDIRTLQEIALDVERRQHGFPSGVDGAAVLRGGVLFAEPGAGRLSTRRLEPAPEFLGCLAVFDTGRPSMSTGEVVGAVRAMLDREPDRVGATLERMGKTTSGFAGALAGGGTPGGVIPLMRDFEACLEDLGVVPSEVRELVRDVEAFGGAAKVSGAGTLERVEGQAGCLLVYHPDPGMIDEWEARAGLTRLAASLGGDGLRREEMACETV